MLPRSIPSSSIFRDGKEKGQVTEGRTASKRASEKVNFDPEKKVAKKVAEVAKVTAQLQATLSKLTF